MNTKTFLSIKRKRTEQGQALVLIVLAIVALFGFAALAIDIGRVYAERRRAQSAVDAAALAWAYAQSQVGMGGSTYDLDQVKAGDPAFASLTKNGYVDTPGRVSIKLAWPADTGAYGKDSDFAAMYPEKVNEYMQVEMTTRVDQIFAQLVFSNSENITVDAVARAMPMRSISLGNAVYATSKIACPGIGFNGNATVNVTGGNIYSNSQGGATTMDNGVKKLIKPNCYSGLSTGSSGSVTVNDGDILVAGDFNRTGHAALNPWPTTQAGSQEVPKVPIPDCSGLDKQDLPKGKGGILPPGIYSTTTINNGDWIMDPSPARSGMYCFDGDLTVNGGSLTGEGVMIVMRKGSISLSGNADIVLKRPNSLLDAKGQQWGGMLIYMLADNDGGVDLSGNNGSEYHGTIYAPGPRNPDNKEKCNISGNNTSIGIHSNLMCNSFGISGNPILDITYNEKENYQIPPTVELAQ